MCTKREVVYIHPILRSELDNASSNPFRDKSLLSHASSILFLAAYDLMLYHYYYYCVRVLPHCNTENVLRW